MKQYIFSIYSEALAAPFASYGLWVQTLNDRLFDLSKELEIKESKPLYLFESRSIPPASERPKALNLLSIVEAPILCENEDMFENKTNG